MLLLPKALPLPLLLACGQQPRPLLLAAAEDKHARAASILAKGKEL